MSDQANQPTEEPTQRRIEKAFEDGQIAFSSELVGGLIVLAGILFFMLAGTGFFRTLMRSIKECFLLTEPSVEHPESLLLMLQRNVTEVGWALMGLMIPMAMVALVAGAMQTRFNISTKVLELKWNRISPQSGMKRIFSTRSLNRGGVAILKATAIIVVAYWIVVSKLDEISLTSIMTYENLVGVGANLLLEVSIIAALLMVAVGGIDLAFQIWKQKQELMMTKQEIRDEQKDIDGDPQVKARIRKIQSEMSKQRISREVPRANVVITNPTHFAVALRYDPTESPAPIVVAKGTDHLAKHIIKIAKENGVAVVERKPVARFLYANVKVGHQIPYELYQAVAEILNYINKYRSAV